MAGRCKVKGKEKGIAYEVKAIADCIKGKEAKGQDATFERELLKAWSKYPEYKAAGRVLEQLDRHKESAVTASIRYE